MFRKRYHGFFFFSKLFIVCIYFLLYLAGLHAYPFAETIHIRKEITSFNANYSHLPLPFHNLPHLPHCQSEIFIFFSFSFCIYTAQRQVFFFLSLDRPAAARQMADFMLSGSHQSPDCLIRKNSVNVRNLTANR